LFGFFYFKKKKDIFKNKIGCCIQTGSHSSHWAPSANLVVALEAGVYVYQISNYNSTEICNNLQTPENPFCHVIWDSAGKFVLIRLLHN
jgi:6-phosphogluconolactonase (cycloisomerase 2 family)